MGRIKIVHRRPGSQNFYARMMVPAALRATLGRREFIKSLGTNNEAEAELLALPLIAEWKQSVRALSSCADNDTEAAQSRASRGPTMAEIEEAALHHGFEHASVKLDDLLARKAKLGPEAFQLAREKFGQEYAAASRRLLAGDHSYWEVRARKVVERRGWNIGEGSSEFQALVDNLSKCGVDLFRRALSILDNPCNEFTPSSHTEKLSARVNE